MTQLVSGRQGCKPQPDSKACLLNQYMRYVNQTCRRYRAMNDTEYKEGCHNILNQN